MRREGGFTTIEWALGIGLIILPLAVVVASVGPWLERSSMGRVMAQESARAMVLADDWDSGVAAAESVARQIASNHGFGSDEWWCGESCLSMTVESWEIDAAGNRIPSFGVLGRGYEIEIEIDVPMQPLSLPFIDDFTAFRWSTSHVEKVDTFRSFP